jgi:importin subunit beta-1
MKALSDVLAYGGNSPVARTAAGLQLKNHLTSKDPLIKLQYQQRWQTFAEDVREYVKKNVGHQCDIP